jgi:plastocyanin
MQKDELRSEGIEGQFLSSTFRTRLVKTIGSPIFFGFVLFVFVTTFPPFEAATELNLAAHMFQHVLIMISGVLIAYPIYKAGRFNSIKNRKTGIVGVLTLIGVVVLWHIPEFWDAAVVNYQVHILEHFSFFGVGLLIGFTVPMLSDHMKMILFVLAVSAHMFYGLALFLISTPIYNSPVSQQSFLGVLLFAPSPAYFIGYLYFTLTSESRRLERDEQNELAKIDPKFVLAQRAYSRTSSSKRIRSLGSIVVPSLTLIMIVTLASYFAFSSFAIAASGTSAHGVNVYIVENPYYWQYSPQSITVVIGINNTVTWVSHSYSIDTVTSSNGAFDSGPLSSGQTFTYTFTKPGVYQYYCEYHPWMKGTVYVLSES